MGGNLKEDYVREQIITDHHFLEEEMRFLTGELTRRIPDNDFAIWQFELIWRFRNLKNRLLRHFELEEQHSFRGEILVRNRENLKKIQELKKEHGEIASRLTQIVTELKGATTPGDKGIKSAASHSRELFELILEHEEIESKLIEVTIDEFKSSGRFLKRPTFSEETVKEWERELDLPLPESYKTVVCNGSYDTPTFSFIPPYLDSHNPGLLLFATWNEISFAFATENLYNGEYSIYVLSESFEPEKRYDDFPDWFKLVFEMASQPVDAE